VKIFPGLGHPSYQVEINEGGTQDNEYEFWRSPAVKENTEHQDDDVLVFLIGKMVGDQESREKVQKENYTAKNHIYVKRAIK